MSAPACMSQAANARTATDWRTWLRPAMDRIELTDNISTQCKQSLQYDIDN